MSNSTLPTKQRDQIAVPVSAGIGESVARPDGTLKVT